MTENAQDSLTPPWVLFLALPPRPSIGPWVQGRQAARDCARVRGFLSVLSGLTRCFVPAGHKEQAVLGCAGGDPLLFTAACCVERLTWWEGEPRS